MMSLCRVFLFIVTAEFVAHSRHDLVGEISLAARAKAFIEGCCEYECRNGFVDGGPNRPTTLARIRDMTLEFMQIGTLEQGAGCEVEQPRADHAATPPEFRYIGQVEIILVVLWTAQRCRLGIDVLLLLADVGVFEDVQSFGVGCHDAILNAVVDHLDEMAGTMGATMIVTLFGSAIDFFASRDAYCGVDTGGQGRKDGVEAFDDFVLAANHLAVTTLESPHAAARPYVKVVDAMWFKHPGVPDIVVVVRVAAVNHNIIGSQQR